MCEYKRVSVIVEGWTEYYFIQNVLCPYCIERGVYMVSRLIDKPGQRGGDVRFRRAKREIIAALKEKDEPIVSTFVDYYGIKEWPGTEVISPNATPEQIANILNTRAKDIISEEYPELGKRYVPFLAVHEFEALLFSDSEVLARHLKINKEEIEAVLSECGSPECVNTGINTAPSKRLIKWNPYYTKTQNGHKIAQEIGIPTIRKACPLFNEWLNQIGVKD